MMSCAERPARPAAALKPARRSAPVETVLRAPRYGRCGDGPGHEMFDREPHAGFVVGDDRRQLARRRRVRLTRTTGTDAARQWPTTGSLSTHGREHQAVDAARDQPVDQFLLPRRIGPDVDHDGGIARSAERLRDAAQDRREAGVGDIGREHADQAGSAGAQARRGHIRLIAERRRRRANPLCHLGRRPDGSSPPLSARDTVEGCTPHRSATSLIVGRDAAALFARSRLCSSCIIRRVPSSQPLPGIGHSRPAGASLTRRSGTLKTLIAIDCNNSPAGHPP